MEREVLDGWKTMNDMYCNRDRLFSRLELKEDGTVALEY